MENRGLADTICIIDYLDNKLSVKAKSLIDSAQIELSVINKIELLAWPAANSLQLNTPSDFIQIGLVHSLEEESTLKTIDTRKTKRIKLPDATIAATAITKDLILPRRNRNDFAGIKDLKFQNPHDL